MSWNPLVLLTGPLGIPNWVIYVLVFAVLFYVYGTWTFSIFDQLRIPSMKFRLPLVGNFLYIAKYGFATDEKLVKKYGKVFGIFEGRTPVIVVCDPAMIREITVKQFDYFVNRRTVGLPMNEEFRHAVSVIKDDEWKGARSVITPSFSGSKMKKMAPLINGCGRELCQAIGEQIKENNGEVEVKYLCGCFTMDVIARTMFGINVSSMKEGENSEFAKNAKAAFETFSLKNPLIAIFFLFPKLSEIAEKVFKYGVFDRNVMAFFKKIVYSIIDARQKMTEKPVDFFQLLLDSQDDDELVEEQKVSALDDTTDVSKQIRDWKVGKRSLSKSEILANSIVFLLAGFETTATAMSWMMYCLALNPECQEKLRDEINEVLDEFNSEPSYEAIASMQYLDQVFCETLRLYPPAQRSDRVCQNDCIVNDIAIPKGMIVNIGIWAVHRNEEFWSEPEKFNPDRFAPENKGDIVPYSWIPFGSGPRNCIGMRLAILEAKIAMVYAVKNFVFSPSLRTEIPVEMKPQGFSAPKTGKIFLGVKPI